MRDGVLAWERNATEIFPPARSTRKKGPPENVLCPKIPSYSARKFWGRFFHYVLYIFCDQALSIKKNGRSMSAGFLLKNK